MPLHGSSTLPLTSPAVKRFDLKCRMGAIGAGSVPTPFHRSNKDKIPLKKME
jgi:hypothetical protein